MRARDLPFATKIRFIERGLWLRPPRPTSYALPLATGSLYVSGENEQTDRNVIWDVFINRCYRADFGGATVIDIGAHKGYFGAYALTHGARTVTSYEPESENFEYLSMTAASFLTRGLRWDTHRMAVTAENGQVALHVAATSWAHSIAVPVADPDSPAGEVQLVPCTAMSDVLESVTRDHPPGRIVVKIDAEGAECDIVLATSEAEWRRVDDVLIEVHDFATCSSADLAAHLERAGFRVVDDVFGVLHLHLDRGLTVSS